MPTRFTLIAIIAVALVSGLGESTASFLQTQVSSEGEMIAFLSDREATNTELYVMNAESVIDNPDGNGPQKLVAAGDGFIVGPSWSPDARRIAYTKILRDARGRLDNHGPFEVWTITLDQDVNLNLSANISEQIKALPWPTPTWSPDGTRLAFIGARETENGDLFSSVYIVASDGSEAEWSLQLPWLAFDVIWSPAGDELLLSGSDEDAGYGVYILAIEDQTLDQIYEGSYPATDWSPYGLKIVVSSFQPSEILMFDSDRRPRVLAQIEGRFPLAVRWSPDGNHIVIGSSNVRGMMKITALDLISVGTGDVTPLISYPSGKHIYTPNWSPEGDRLLYTTTDINRIRQGDIYFADLWIYDLDSNEIQRLTTGEFHDAMGVWSPSSVSQH